MCEKKMIKAIMNRRASRKSKSDEDIWGNKYETESEDINKITSITGFLPFSEEDFNVLTRWVSSKDKKILEAGCGSGRSCIGLSEKFPKSKIIGVDISNKTLKIARRGANLRKLKNVSFKKGDIFNLPFKNNSFDVVFNKGVIEHFTNYKEAIEEMVRVTKIGGKVIIAVPNKLNIVHSVYYYFSKNISKTYKYGMEILFTPRKLKENFIQFGLKNIEQDGFSPFYRLAKLTSSRNIFLKTIQYFLRMIAIFCHYVIQKPLDFISIHKFSKYFGFEIVAKGEKPGI